MRKRRINSGTMKRQQRKGKGCVHGIKGDDKNHLWCSWIRFPSIVLHFHGCWDKLSFSVSAALFKYTIIEAKLLPRHLRNFHSDFFSLQEMLCSKKSCVLEPEEMLQISSGCLTFQPGGGDGGWAGAPPNKKL